jgi:hypothetical protein
VAFLLDQDVPEDLTYLLAELGHEVLRVRDVLGPEAADSLVLQFAFEGNRLLPERRATRHSRRTLTTTRGREVEGDQATNESDRDRAGCGA